MSEDEQSMEHVQEHIHHHAHQSAESWVGWAALTAAVFAALAAIGGAMASEHLNESNHNRIKSNDQWAFYQAKSIKTAILYAKDDMLKSLGKEPPEKDAEYIKQNEEKMTEVKAEAEKMDLEADHELKVHKTFEHGVTLFHISIAVVAVAVLTKRKRFWFVSMAFSAIGLAFLLLGFLS